MLDSVDKTSVNTSDLASTLTKGNNLKKHEVKMKSGHETWEEIATKSIAIKNKQRTKNQEYIA